MQLTPEEPRRYQSLRVSLALVAITTMCGATSILVFQPVTGTAKVLTVVVVSVVSISAYITYWFLSFSVHTQLHRHNNSTGIVHDYGSIISRAADISNRVHFSQVISFRDFIVKPSDSFERITETVEPLLRSTKIVTSYTFQVPVLALGRTLSIPIFLTQRGELIDDLAVRGPQSDRISTLTQAESISLEVAILRLLVELTGPSSLTMYLKTIELKIVKFLSASTPYSIPETDAIVDEIVLLPRVDGSQQILSLIIELLRKLRLFYPVLVVADSSHAALSGHPFQERLRFTVERSEIPKLLTDRTTGMNGWLNRRRDGIRMLLGVRPGMVAVPLNNANRCGSYHLQIRGPEGSYLARQRVAYTRTGETVILSSSQYAMRARFGQRASHLYIRRGSGFESLYFENHFYECMPGALGTATVSALAAAVLIWISAFIRLGVSHEAAPDLVPVLLAFPAVVGAWLGFDQARNLFGGVLMARVSTIVTVTVALAASGFYVLGPNNAALEKISSGSLLARPGSNTWLILAVIATLNLVACVGGWMLRVAVERSFVGRDQVEKSVGIDIAS